MPSRIALFLALVPMAACDGSPTTPKGVTLSVETLARAPASGFSDRGRIAIHGDDALAEIWETFHAGLQPVPAPPAVDFSRETVVLAAAGTRPDGCYAIDVTHAEVASDGSVEFFVTETVPGAACGCLQFVTQPVHLVRIARAPTTERFRERIAQLNC